MKWTLNHPSKFKSWEGKENDQLGTTINYKSVILAFFIGFAQAIIAIVT